jgi:phosphoglycolate phosphatase-like HAD superfamily hydrolase|tara:strand:- start:215 stop:814 length:600 start_codon:yes stop_codon:yes gene_type:complete
MALKVIVFDFDGTLIESNCLKFDTFFELFPPDKFHNLIIKNVLKDFLEESRYVILKEILKRIDRRISKHEDIELKSEELAKGYNLIVTNGAKKCNEKSGASEVLVSLSKRYKLYLSSTTPETSLKEIVKHRKWEGFFCGIFGYPNDKTSVLFDIIKRESIIPDELLVVGDGKSDKDSANSAKCRFFQIDNDSSLIELLD